MKKFTLKALLVATGLVMGGNAWADPIETVGASDFSVGYLEGKSTVKTMASGTTFHYTFTQSKATDGNYKGWLLYVGPNGSEVTWDNGISIVRGDNWDDKWPTGDENTPYGSNAGCTSNFNWDTFNADMNGATVDMTITYTLGSLTMSSTISKGETVYSYSYAKTIDSAPTSVDVCLSVNEAYLEITTAEFVTPAITAIPATFDFTAENALIAPFDAGSIRKGTNVQALTVTNQTSTAWFDSDQETAGNQPYTLANNEEVTFTLNAYHGWLASGKTTTVTIWASDEKPLVSYVYNANDKKITDVKIGDVTPDGFVAFANNHLNGLVANSRNPFADDGQNPIITISISGSKYVNVSFVRNGTTDAAFSGKLGDDVTAELEKITIVDASNNADRAYHLGKLSITTETVSATDITYVFEDTEGNSLASIKANQTMQGNIGEAIADVIPESYKNTFYNSDESVKYVYDSFTCSDETVPATGTTVTLKFSAIAKFTYNVNAVDAENNVLATIATVSGFTGETKEVFWSKYVKIDGQWYVANAPFYQGSITESGEKNVTYTPSDIAYFIECENMNGVRTDRWVLETSENNSGYRKIRINNYYTTIYTDAFAESGVFDLYLPYNNSNASNHTYQIRTRDNSSNLTNVAEWTCEGGSKVYTLKGIVIPAGSSLAISCDGISGNSNARMDYLTLTPSKASATIGATGYTSFASSYALDLDQIEGATAYYASSVTDGSVNLLQATGTVAAGTGLILKGTDGAAVTIPAVTTGEAIEGNLLVGCPTETTINNETAGYANFYVLSAEAAEFQNLEKYVTAGNTVTIPAGKAYLNATTSGSAKLRVIFEGEDATAITTIEAVKAANDGIIYNLRGQRVAQPTKGIYIQNGKKILVK
ncbi:MAG: hypothetical protein IJV06_08680 [Bacteroidaceae bacterium]|nr:hypothetical protein [Bacteroidaceae bacterium]